MPQQPLRPGGRSARVHESVHRAVRTLLAQGARNDLTVPLVASTAGVTPSTIYRRWGDLATLLADAAMARVRSDISLLDTGAFASDITAWAERYVEEMSSVAARAMIRDRSPTNGEHLSAKCGAFTRGQLQILLQRAANRGEATPSIDFLIDQLVAPIIFHLFHDDRQLAVEDHLRALLDKVLRTSSDGTGRGARVGNRQAHRTAGANSLPAGCR